MERGRLLIGTSTNTPCWPGAHDQIRVLVEERGARWPAESDARAAGLQVLTCSGQTAAPCPALAGQPCHLAIGADVIVVAHTRDDEMRRRLLHAHASVHPGVPVCLEASRQGVASRPTG